MFVLLVLAVSIVVPRLRPDRDSIRGLDSGGKASATGANILKDLGTFANVESRDIVSRKNIYDRNLNELAVGFKLSSIYVRPVEVRDAESFARRISPLMGLNEEVIFSSLKSEGSLLWLGRKIDETLARRVMELGLPGLYRTHEIERYYPNHFTAAHILGFVRDEQGLDGIEYFYDNELRAETVSQNSGGHLILSLDLRIQRLLEKQLAELIASTKATSAKALVMEANTGAILAMASLPAFDPNRFWEFSVKERRNRVLTDGVHTAGMDGLVRYALALSKGEKINRKTKSTADKTLPGNHLGAWNRFDNGFYVSRELMPFYIEHGSSVEEEQGLKMKLGLNSMSGIDLPTQQDKAVSGKNPAELAVDQEDSASALNLLTAFTRLVNGGKSITPHLLDSLWVSEKGHQERNWTTGGAAVSSDLSQQILDDMQSEQQTNTSVFCVESLNLVHHPVDTESYTENSGTQKEQQEMEKSHEVESIDLPEKFQTLLLGVTPLKQPRITLLITLDDAEINKQEYSPVRTAAEQLGKKAHAWNGVGRMNVKEGQFDLISDKTRASWSRDNGHPELVPQQDIKAKVMPDVKGLSLRNGLQELQQLDLSIKIHGVGTIVGQFPEAGKALKGHTCILKLAAKG